MWNLTQDDSLHTSVGLASTKMESEQFKGEMESAKRKDPALLKRSCKKTRCPPMRRNLRLSCPASSASQLYHPLPAPGEERMKCVSIVTRRGLCTIFRPLALANSSLCTTANSARTTVVRHHTATAARRPLRVCVVGSGPAGFYVTKYILKASLCRRGEDAGQNYCCIYIEA